MKQNNKKNKHIYSTYTLIGFIIIITLTIFVSALGSSDIDELCNTNNAILKRTTGLWDCSTTHYAEGYYHNYTGQKTITMINNTHYSNITGLTFSNVYGINTNNPNGITITKEGTYDITGTISFHGGNGGEYEVELHVNDVGQPDCAFFRSTSTTAIGDASLSCLKTLTIGDELMIKIKDLSSPYQDVDIVTMNFKIVEVQ